MIKMLFVSLYVFVFAFTFKNPSYVYVSAEKHDSKIFSGHSVSKVEDVVENEGLTVKCGEKNWWIIIKRKYFKQGIPLSPGLIRLGEENTTGDCTPNRDFLTLSEVIVSAGLQDCGSRSQVSGDWLIYSNKLIFPGPRLTWDGILILTHVPVVLPIECHYKRRFRVSAEPLSPTWLPMTSTLEATGLLHFSLHIIKGDSISQGQSTVYQQGEPLLLEAAVDGPTHLPLKVYVDHCVASVDSDPMSKPSYEFISEHGCLIDSLLPNSLSRFYSRPGQNILRFSVQAFHFPQDERNQVFISCQLRAAPAHHPSDLRNKACYFHGPSLSWHSVEGNNSVCRCCETKDCKAGKGNMSSNYLRKGEQTRVHVGPLQILPKKSHWPGQLTIGDMSLT